MKRSVKTALLLSCALILLGAALFTGAAVYMGFDLTKASMTPLLATNTYDVTEDFTSIYVNGGECSVKLLPSDDDTCKVVILETKKIHHTVKVTDGSLSINRWDDRSWLDHFGLYLYPLEVTIYLPQKEFDSLDINVASGNIDMAADFSFQNIRLSSSSGTIELRNISCEELTANVISGSIILSDCYADTVDLKATSGYIGFFNCDGKSITMKTVSGNINANLQSGKTFSVSTVSGSITVPPDSSPDTCTATTVSGNIYITVE